MIIQKDHFVSSRTIVAKNMQSYKKGKFIVDVNSFIARQFFTIEKDFPPQEKFVILKNNESFEKDIVTDVYLKDFPEQYKNDSSYYMGKIFHIWGGQYSEGEKLRKKWKIYGYLLFEPIFPEPFQIYIKIPSKISKCS